MREGLRSILLLPSMLVPLILTIMKRLLTLAALYTLTRAQK
jgi:hypothetical protein